MNINRVPHRWNVSRKAKFSQYLSHYSSTKGRRHGYVTIISDLFVSIWQIPNLLLFKRDSEKTSIKFSGELLNQRICVRKPDYLYFSHVVFFGLNEVYRSLKKRSKERWQRMWVVKRFDRTRGINNTPGIVIHPLVHKHPVTGQKVQRTTIISPTFYCLFYSQCINGGLIFSVFALCVLSLCSVYC